MHFICPLCQLPLTCEPKRWYCANNHSFDVAKQGYINLLPVQHKKSLSPGDDAAMVIAREAFLSAGYYAPLRDRIAHCIESLSPHRLLDIGCGEGYYTAALSDVCNNVIAIDIAKTAVQKTARKTPSSVQSLVASAAHLPIADDSIDVITSLFSPILTEEFARVLCSKGYLVIAKPDSSHLIKLRQLLFEQVKPHHSDKFIDTLAPSFTLTQKETVSFSITLDNTALRQLITMTPYAYRATPKRRTTAESLNTLTVSASLTLYTFQKVV